MQISRFRARPPAAFALALFGLLPLAWKASEAAPGHGAAHSALRAHSAPRPHGAPTAGPPTAVPLYTFTDIPDGLGPQSRLLQGSDGNFYGTTTGGGSFGFGAIYRLTPAGKLTVLASFPNTQGGSKHPSGPLVEGLNTDGTPNGAFYGLTDQGGDTGAGTVYLFAADGGSPTGFSITQLYSFTGGADGGRPLGALTVGRKADGTPDGYLYGTTSQGGTSADGTAGGGVVFRVPKDGFAEDVLHTFAAVDTSTGTAPINDGGAVPRAGLLQRKGATGWGSFIGTASSGGAGGAGTVFSLTPAGKFVTIHDFLTTADGLDGRSPQSGLVQGANGALYGTTFTGGGNGTGTGSGVGNGTGNGIGSGTVYRLVVDSNKSTGFNYSQVAALGPDTSNPNGELIEATDGKLYGTSTFGGATYDGSVFRIDADKASATGYSATVVQDFLNSKTQGGYLLAGVIQGADGDLYGATTVGGSASDGTLFRLNIVPNKNPAPTITGTEYLVASDGSAQIVAIQGDHFVQGVGVTVDGTAAQSVTFADAKDLADVLGHPLTAGTHTVVVTNPDGQSASATLTTLDAPVVKSTTALTDANGNVFLLVTGRSFGTPGYNGDPVGASLNVSDSKGAPIKNATILVPAAAPAQAGGPQQIIAALDTTDAAPGPLTVTVADADNQSSQGQTFEVYPFDQTEYAISIDPSLLLQAYQLYLQSKGTPAPGPTTRAIGGQGKEGPGGKGRTSLASGPPHISPPIGYQVNPNGTATLTINGSHIEHGGKLSISTTFTGTTLDATVQGSAHFGTQLVVISSPALPAGDHTVTLTNLDGQTTSATLSVFPSSPTQVVLGPTSYGIPVPIIAITASGLATAATGLLSQGGGGLLGQDDAGLIATGSGSLISQDGGGVISNDGGSLISQDGGGIVSPRGGLRAAAATNSVAVTGLVADIASDAGQTGSLGLTPRFGSARAAGPRPNASTNAPLTFTLLKHDAGAARGQGASDITVSLNYADGTSALLLDLSVAPGRPDVVAYLAPGVTLTPKGATPPPQVTSLAPTLTTLSPSTALVGSPDLTLAVTGTLFTSGAVVNWNGKPLATTVVSGTQATAVVPAALLSTAGTAQVTLANPAPGGGESAALPFVVAAPPAPTLTALSPSTALAGSPDLTLFVTGTLFAPGAVVNWNGKPLTTTFVSGTQATAVVPAAFLSAAGTAQVTIADPAPGGQSAALPFVITAPPVPLHTFAAGLQMLSVTEDYAAVGLSAALTDSTHPMVVWNPATGVYDAHTDLHPGVGYWVRLSRATDLLDTGALPLTTAPFPIPLKAGWNMIGDPFPSPVALSSLTVRDAAGTSGTFRQAVSGGVVSGTLYAYPAGSTQYQKVGQGGSLTPFDGEWVYAFRDCTLLVPAR